MSTLALPSVPFRLTPGTPAFVLHPLSSSDDDGPMPEMALTTFSAAATTRLTTLPAGVLALGGLCASMRLSYEDGVRTTPLEHDLLETILRDSGTDDAATRAFIVGVQVALWARGTASAYDLLADPVFEEDGLSFSWAGDHDAAVLYDRLDRALEGRAHTTALLIDPHGSLTVQVCARYGGEQWFCFGEALSNPTP